MPENKSNNMDENKKQQMKICGKKGEQMYCLNNILNAGSDYVMKLTTLRKCDVNVDKRDDNIYCRYYEDCVKPPA